MNDKIFDMLVHQEEITWQSIIFDLVKKEQMDPWDIDIKLLAQRFIEMVKQLKEMDFRISGRVILAAAILLRIKSNRLLNEDMNELDRLIASNEETQDEFYEGLEAGMPQGVNPQQRDYELIPRTPQPRKRKISVYDLVDALNKALEVKVRREDRMPAEHPEVRAPTNVVDISVIIEDIFSQVRSHYTSKGNVRLTFSQMVPSGLKKDMVYTFIPLLHLSNQRRVDLEQEHHFGEIGVVLLNENQSSPKIDLGPEKHDEPETIEEVSEEVGEEIPDAPAGKLST
jgi:segregation and condensation protein A